ncbi:Trichodiene oxygenase [Cytospora mali]|uniref:Trichodiene oxygenase n=1 Tax=Cytospora mali TaxID=578113 RepID=A0A194VK28_CYTMA|nr:Trichodiene oxygenase [Valsa mali]
MLSAKQVTHDLLGVLESRFRYASETPMQDLAGKVVYMVVFFYVSYQVFLAVYRVYFSPLSRIPGPKLAALTYLYESYYEIVLGGQYFKRVAQMHEQYGPIVRVTPNEIHFNDPEFIDMVYPTIGRKTNKPVWFAQRTGTPYSIVSTPDHDLHRRRRNALNSFFSVASIRRLEPIMKKYMAKLIARMEKAGSTGEVLQMHHLFKACASDVITIYAFDDCFGFMDTPDCGKAFFESTDNMPTWLVKVLFPSLSELRDRQDWWITKVREIRNSPNPERVKKTIFEGIFNSSLPAEEKTDQRLASEAQLVVFAGEGTTAHTLTCCLYQLLANPNEVQRLRDELKKAVPDPENIQLSQVDSLPYLNAVIQEAVRLHPGVMARQVRISPEVPIVYNDKNSGKAYSIPPNTVTSMSPLDIHLHPEAFGSDAYQYRPQRWIDNPQLSRYFIGFSRGSRNCVGMTLARREMAIILATLFLKWDVYNGKPGQGPTLELYDTERARDIDANGDYIIPVPAVGSKGLRVMVRN